MATEDEELVGLGRCLSDVLGPGEWPFSTIGLLLIPGRFVCYKISLVSINIKMA